MRQIAILGHWHTGTTLAAKIFRACGMEVGNENTYWDKDCEAQCEHSLLNQIGEQMVLGNISESEAEPRICDILESYVNESRIKGWKCYGVKATHCTYQKTWPVFKRCFEDLWTDVVYVTCKRPLISVIESTRDPNWSAFDVAKSYVQQVDVPEAYNLYYPISYLSGMIKEVVTAVGLKWAADGIFDQNRVRSFTEECIGRIYHGFP